MPTEPEVKAVRKALENPKYRWRTINGVSSETGLSRQVVTEVIRSSPDWLVRSSVPSTTGEALFTTREHYRETASATDKVIGVLKNRLR